MTLPEKVDYSKKPKAKIVQFSDENHTLPDGSRISYSESSEKLVMTHKLLGGESNTYIYDRITGCVFVNGKPGGQMDKKEMLRLGAYLLGHCSDQELMALDVYEKGE